MCQSPSCVLLFATSWAVAHQAPVLRGTKDSDKTEPLSMRAGATRNGDSTLRVRIRNT